MGIEATKEPVTALAEHDSILLASEVREAFITAEPNGRFRRTVRSGAAPPEAFTAARVFAAGGYRWPSLVYCPFINKEERQVFAHRSVRRLVAFVVGLGAVVGVAIAPASAQVQNASKPKRFTQLTLETVDPQARQVTEEILKISSIGLAGPYNVMLRSPVFADRMKRLLDYLRFNTSLPIRLNEFAILIQGRLWTSQVEWYAHYPLALKAGLPASVADDLKANIRPRGMKPDEEVVYDVCMTMSTKHEISDELFNKARTILGEQQLVDLIAVSGTYVTAAMLLSLGEESSPADKPLPFPEKGR